MHLMIVGAASYEQAALVVKAVTGREENVLTEYNRIIAEGRKNQPDQFLNGTYFFTHQEKTYFLSTTLPNKKFKTADTLFIFKKVKKEKS